MMGGPTHGCINLIIVNWNTKDDLQAAIASCYAHSAGLDREVMCGSRLAELVN